ncbi:hypothetical protein MRB53_034975 [Persea americana]|uniref:Uncharacterized protein n=1 Tax=Persea americana TaxID=3435 RepID=A0ACC2K3L4_PERAE|nr:hypothetical protein MRB53_034975 [Persea americana]
MKIAISIFKLASAPTKAATPTLSLSLTQQNQQEQRDEEGIHLLTLLLQFAKVVSTDNFKEANQMLIEITEPSTPFGTTAQRVAAYFSKAMTAHISAWLGRLL